MQEKRNIRLLVSFGVLVIAIVLLVLMQTRDAEKVVDPGIFRITDFTKVDKVVLTKQGKLIELKFDGARWKVNDQLADRRMIDVLFATLQQAEPKRPVAESMQDSVNINLNNEGVAVKLFISDELQKEFIAGGNELKTQAYFKDKTDEKLYVMVIPGYRVYVSGIFELNENDWKDKYVFSFNWSNFQTLKSIYPENPKNDFEIGMGKRYFEVKGIADVDTTKLNDYLDAVSVLTVNQYVSKENVPNYDSLLRTQAFLEIQVSDVSGKTYSLMLTNMKDKATVLGVIQGTQLAFFDRRRLADIVKSRNWFVKK